MPIRVRLTLLHAVVVLIVVAGLGAFLVTQLRADLVEAIDRELRERSAAVTATLRDALDRASTVDRVAAGFRSLCGAAAPGPESSAALLRADGRWLARCPRRDVLRPDRDALRRALGGERPLATVSAIGEDEPWRTVTWVTDLPAGGRVALVTAESLEEVEDAVERVSILLLIAGPAAFAVTAIGGWWLARRALLPVARMSAQARDIGIDHLHERVPAPAVRDEVGDLGRTLNAMLDRLESGVERNRRLVADASHALRSPLAVMGAELDVRLARPDLPTAARAVLLSTREEVDRLSRTVNNLLTLAQAGEGRLDLLVARTDLRAVVDRAAGPLQPIAEARRVRLVVGGASQVVRGDGHWLALAVENLIDNALKFTPAGGEVRVTTWAGGGEAGVTVDDDGPGIPEDAREDVFERFARLEDARASAPGSGLGLAICREIATAHRGRIWVEDSPGRGSAFMLALPAAAPAAR